LQIADFGLRIEGADVHDAKFRAIPSIDELRRRAAARALEARFGAAALVDALRAAAAEARVALRDAPAADTDAVIAEIERTTASRLEAAFSHSLQPVINATGVIVHTNLGRAPLAAAAVARVAAVAAGYSSLEYDLGRGSRGRRDVHAEPMLCRLTGAEAAVVVNNNAAATLLVLAALAAGREVVVSRGELVEIGGGFRVPDVMAQSGAVLREVGTTNKTRAGDYAAAVSDRTALILRVHPSNFRVEGFTERPSLDELVTIGRRLKVPVAEDLGSGQLTSDASHPIGRVEPAVAASIAAGVDICCFSGDKLLGGPQAGIIVGRAALVDRVRTHPLMRALRVDKMTYAALDATLAEYAAGRAHETIPVQRMLAASADDIRERAAALAAKIGALAGWRAELVEGASTVGGGSAPGVELKTWLVAIGRVTLSPDALDALLRRCTPAIVGRIERDRYVLDLRTVFAAQDDTIVKIVSVSAENL
jgi:L-seryl-tRNA(Ser) seleniumtransferase